MKLMLALWHNLRVKVLWTLSASCISIFKWGDHELVLNSIIGRTYVLNKLIRRLVFCVEKLFKIIWLKTLHLDLVLFIYESHFSLFVSVSPKSLTSSTFGITWWCRYKSRLFLFLMVKCSDFLLLRSNFQLSTQDWTIVRAFWISEEDVLNNFMSSAKAYMFSLHYEC